MALFVSKDRVSTDNRRGMLLAKTLRGQGFGRLLATLKSPGDLGCSTGLSGFLRGVSDAINNEENESYRAGGPTPPEAIRATDWMITGSVVSGKRGMCHGTVS